MKILLIDNSSLTPIGESLFCEKKTGNFALELKELGHSITMYGQIVSKTSTIHAFDIRKNDIDVYGIKRSKNKILNYFQLYIKIIPLIIKADFVYIFYPSAFKYVAFLCMIFKKPYGLYVRGELGLKDRVSKIIYKNSYKIFTVTNYFTNLINKLAKIEISETIKPMLNIDEKDLVSLIDNKNIRIFKILFLARLEEDKGIKELLYAVHELKNMNYNFKLIVVGDGSYKQEFISIAEELNILDFLDVKGAIFDVDEIRNIYLDSSVYILPTYHEGFPRTLYEAMIYGTPIITTFVGGIPYIMEDRVNCLRIDPKSIQSILDALIFSIENYEKMLDCAKNAQVAVRPIIDSKRLSHAQALNSSIHNI